MVIDGRILCLDGTRPFMLSLSRAQRLRGLSNVGFTAVLRTAPYPVYHMCCVGVSKKEE